MHVIFIIVLLFKISKAEDSVSKYIDLLPDKEKQEFLDKIARRILEEVQTKDDRPQGSAELTDGQLDEHEDFVNRILKEETHNFRKHSNSTTEGVASSVRTLDGKNDINNVDGYADLTLRTDRSKRDDSRRVFTGYSQDNENNSKNDTDGNETEIDIQVKNFRKSKEFADGTTLIDEEFEHVTHDNPVTENNVDYEPQEGNSHDIGKDSVDKKIENENIKPEKDDSLMKNVDVMSESNIHKISDLNINNERVPSTEAIEEPENTSKRDTRSYNESDAKQSSSSKTHKEPNTVEKLGDFKVINVEITPATEKNKAVDRKRPLSENDNVIKIEETTFGLNPSIDTTTVTTEGITTTLSPIKYSKFNNENKETLHNEHTENNEEIQNVSVKQPKENFDSKKFDANSYYLINNLSKMLRQNIAENDAKDMQNKNFKIMTGQFDESKINEYKVHEVSSGSSPFVKVKSPNAKPKTPEDKLKPQINEEQPFYVPIYNYSPNNAFYNPHNIYGPNYGSDSEKDGYTINNNNNDDAGSYNTDEDSDKDSHANQKDLHDQSPASLQNIINNINHKVKSISHMGAKDSKLKEKSQRNSKNIAVDYYFGRMRSDDESNEETEKEYPTMKSSQVRDFHIPLESHEVHKHRDISYEINPTTQNKTRHHNTGTKNNFELMQSTLDMVPEQDTMTTLIKLQKLDLQKAEKTKKRSNDLDTYITVLGDMIKENNRGLVNYDWLGTAVDLQTAIKKMEDMADMVQNGYDIHPSDMELLKYLVYLHTYAKEELKDTKVIGKELRAMLLPRNKNKKNKGIIKESGLLNRAWLIRMTEQQSKPDDGLRDFEEFLKDLESALYDLHTALKYIAMITKYKNQKWFENLKQIHIDSKRKQLLEIILHMCTSRLLGLIEETSHKGLEDDFLGYVAKNVAEVKRSKEEFVFVLRLIQELKK